MFFAPILLSRFVIVATSLSINDIQQSSARMIGVDEKAVLFDGDGGDCADYCATKAAQ